LYIKAKNPAGWAYSFDKKQRIVAVSYRRINGDIARVKNISDEIMSDVNQRNALHNGV
jgi:hypothetical protein